MTPLSIGFDWDDVIMPWFDPAIEICKRAGLHRSDVVEFTQWRQHEDLGCTMEEWLAALSDATESGELYDTTPYAGAIEGMRELYWAGHYIHIVTARGTWPGNPHNDVIREITRRQVEEFAAPHHSLTFTKDKASVPTDFFIDDNLKNYEALRQAGVNAYLLNRPWNQYAQADHRVDSVAEFVDIINQQEAA